MGEKTRWTEGLGKKQNSPDHSTVEVSKITEKSPGATKRFFCHLDFCEDYQLLLVGKIRIPCWI